MNRKISLITISFNSSRSILKTLKSVSKQSFRDFEYILIDGKSTDNTLEIAKEFSCFDKIISESDNGIYDAFNKGIKNSSGNIIGFLNSDDTFYNDKTLETIYQQFDEQTDCVFGDLIYTNSQNKIKRYWKGSTFKKGLFKKAWMPAHPTFFCKKNIYEEHGLYDQSFNIAGDFELMLRFLEKKNIKSKYIPEILVNMKLGGISNDSLINKLKILKEEFRAFKQNNIEVNKIYYLFHKLKKIKEFKI